VGLKGRFEASTKSRN